MNSDREIQTSLSTFNYVQEEESAGKSVYDKSEYCYTTKESRKGHEFIGEDLGFEAVRGYV